MRPLRIAAFASIAAAALLSGCSSSSHHPSTTTTTTTTAAPTTTAPSTTIGTTTTTTIPVSPTTSAPPTTAVTSGPRIVSLTGPPTPVQCNSPTSVELHWVTANAKSVDLSIDGAPVFATYSNGRHDELVPFACDGNTQTYRLTARAANGQTTSATLKLPERKSL